MTHMAPMPDSAGDFGDFKPVETQCPKCLQQHVRARCWESSCGGYEDYQYRCFNCGKTWWVEGPDA